MRTLAGEREIIATNERLIVLTTHRVRLDARVAGRARLVSITLDAGASCGVVTRTYPMLLVIAAIAALLGGIQLNDRGGAPGLLFGGAAVLGVIYLLTRRSTLRVTSGGEAIEVPATSMSHKDLVSFVDALEEAKLAFTGRLGR